MTKAYREVKENAWDIGFAHGLANHSLSEMMVSVERTVGRAVSVDLWLDLFAGHEAGKKERLVVLTVPTEKIDWSGVPY